MPDLDEHEIGRETPDSPDDLQALWKIKNSKEFDALFSVFKKMVRRARKGLDDWHKDEPQTNGFYRGQIYTIKQLYNLMAVTANPERVMPNSI
jgi:hypothetical protein